MPPNYEWNCDECDRIYEMLVPYETRDEPKACVHCGSMNTTRRFPSPAVLKASYHDGHKRKGWDKLKEAAKLTREKAVAKTDQRRKEIAGEIRKLGVRTEKD